MLLNCHSYYSFRYGTLSPAELTEEVKNKGYRSFVLSDINNTSAVLDTLRNNQDSELKVIPGIDFRNGARQMYVGIAINNKGFKTLNEHLSQHLMQEQPFEADAPEMDDVFIVYPFAGYREKSLRNNEFIGISAKELSQLPFSPHKHLRHKMVILQTLSFITKKHFNAHRLLRAIDTNSLLSKLPVSEQSAPEAVAMPEQTLRAAFAEYPDILHNTESIMATCKVDFTFDKLDNKNLRHYTGTAEGDVQKLRELALEGLSYRYPDAGPPEYERLEKELEVIAKMHFASYFLINWDIVTYARNKGYFYVGRGSGANSMIAYLLRITDVDPIDLDLYFERFINEHRSNAPDFDIDFSWRDREDITRYIFERFGTRNNVALLGTYSTFQHDAVTRELGKVFGLPPAEIDRLQPLKSENGTTDPIAQLVHRYSQLIAGFPNHLSIHASGILISEEPITSYTATFLPPKGYPTTQFSMLEAEDIGLFKFDILSQRGLGKIKDAVEIVKENKGVTLDIHDVRKFKHDEKIKELLRIGKCIGCFYVESPAMRMLLTKLQADDYLRLVAASSIIRPGVSKSGMMNEYIQRYRHAHKREKAREALPELYDLLKETYGVMVYQEDVIKVAHLFADLTLAEADYLRRGMSWKFKQRNEFHLVREKFFENCRKKNFAEETILGIWNQIESFANFAFSKGHSASYAVESYQALFLKAYYPLEYMVATLNNGGGFYRTEIYIHEARMHGAEIIPPCINNSTQNTVIRGAKIYLGLNMVQGLETTLITALIKERDTNGAFETLYDFVKRTRVTIEQLRLLIRVGAFKFLNTNKKELLWQAHMLINPLVKAAAGGSLFDITPQQYKLPELEHSWMDDAFDEIELLGFSLCSPFALLRQKPDHSLKARDLQTLAGQQVEITAYLVNVKNTRTSSGQRMLFGTFLDMDGHWLDTVHFPPSARAFPFSGPGCYLITGRVVNDLDFIYIDVQQQSRLAVISRDE